MFLAVGIFVFSLPAYTSGKTQLRNVVLFRPSRPGWMRAQLWSRLRTASMYSMSTSTARWCAWHTRCLSRARTSILRLRRLEFVSWNIAPSLCAPTFQCWRFRQHYRCRWRASYFRREKSGFFTHRLSATMPESTAVAWFTPACAKCWAPSVRSNLPAKSRQWTLPSAKRWSSKIFEIRSSTRNASRQSKKKFKSANRHVGESALAYRTSLR